MKQKRLVYSKAYTLVELMISMALLGILGLLVVQVLRSTMQTWNYSENQRQLYETAWSVTQKIQDDMESICSLEDPLKESRLIIDFDSQSRQRIRFIRRIEEKKHSVLRNSGKDTLEKGYSEYYFTSLDSEKNLRASGGLAEIVYLQGEQNSLWRGFKTPIGGKESFFLSQNIEAKEKFSQTCQLLSSEILYFGIECWGKNTTHWDTTDGNSSLSWNSDLNAFPMKVQILLAISGQNSPMAFLSEDIQEKQDTILFKSEINFPVPAGYKNFVRIGAEWVSYKECIENRITGIKRGIFGTQARSHKAGSQILWGVFFTTTLYLPCYHGL